MRNQNHALDLDTPLLDEPDQRLEVKRRFIDCLISGNENIGGHVGHPLLLCYLSDDGVGIFWEPRGFVRSRIVPSG